MLFSKGSKKKNKKSLEHAAISLSTVAFKDNVVVSDITILLSANLSPAGGYTCKIINNGKKDVYINRFCVNNFANAIRNSGIGRNFHGLIKSQDTKKFEISFVGYELANRDPVLFNFLWHSDSIALFVDGQGKPFKIESVIRT
jgi:hypothetical protein